MAAASWTRTSAQALASSMAAVHSARAESITRAGKFGAAASGASSWPISGQNSFMPAVMVELLLEKALHRYRVHLGLTPFPNSKEETPLKFNLRTGRPVTLLLQ